MNEQVRGDGVPRATVVIPARNEKEFIGPCLDSICAQTVADIQVVVVDGDSDDGTVEIVREYAARDPRVELVHNPDRIIPKSLNRAVEVTRAPYLVRVDAHATVPPGYVEKILEHFADHEWGGVGGRKDGVGHNRHGRAVAAAMASRFGVGNSTYHYGTKQQTVEHIPFGAYPTDLVRSLGGWDENLRVNQDFEFDYRIRESGRELLFDPRLVIDWYCRQSVRDLFDQYRRYGRGKVRVIAKHPRSVRLRHLVAPALVAALLASVVAALVGVVLAFPLAAWAPVAAAGPYVAGVVVASLVTARHAGPGWPLLPLAFGAMHIGWGLGFWSGVGGLLVERIRGPADHTPPGGSGGTGPGDDLGRRAVGGVVWHGIAQVSGRLVLLIATILLARLLTPRDFGVVGLALVFVGYAETLSSLGVGQAVIYFEDRPRVRNAALVLALGTALPFVVVGQLLAGSVAAFFGNADVEALFRVVVLSLLITAAGQVPDAMLRKQLRFRRRLVAGLVQAGVRGGVSIGLALAGAGPWSIAGGLVAGQVAFVALVWALSGLRVRWSDRPRWDDIRGVAAYGAPAAGASLLSTLVLNVDYLIVGRWLGADALGLYTLAFRIPEMAIISALFLVSAVAFPVFSSVGSDRRRLARGYLTVVRAQSAYGAVVGAWIAVAAPVVVPVVFGRRWEAASAAMQALGLYAAFRAMGAGAVDAYNAIGRPRLAAGVAAIRFAVLVPVLVVTVRMGITAVALGQAVAALLFVGLAQGVAARVLSVPVPRMLGALRTGLVGGLASAAGSSAALLVVPSGLGAVVLSGTAAASAAGVVLLVTDRELVAALRAGVRRRAEAVA